MNGRTCTEITGSRKRVISFLLAIILIGVLAGTMLYCFCSDLSIFENKALNHGFIRNGNASGLADIFFRAAGSTGILLFVLMLAGFSSAAQPLEFSVLLYRGLALGISLCSLYSGYGARGFLATVFMVLPHAAITSVILAAAAREALRLSNAEAAFVLRRQSDDEAKPDIKLYFLRFLVLYIFLLASSFIDCLLSIMFTNRIFISS